MKYPGCRYQASASSLSVAPEEGGFQVAIHVVEQQFIVHFDGWHDQFDSQDAALNCFAYGLSDACRLEVAYRGATPTKWTVQALQDGAWVSDSSTGMLLVPFWRPRTVRHLQNRFIVGGEREERL